MLGLVTSNALAGTAVNLSTARCCVGFISIGNLLAAAGFLQLFNKLAANVTPGTTKPDMVVQVALSASKEFSLGEGVVFDTALSAVVTTTAEGGTGGSADVAIGIK